MFNPLNLITKFIKSSNQKELDRIGKIVEKINSYEEDFKNLNLNDLDKALKEYMTRPEISQEARETINLILNEFIRKIGDYKKH